MNCASSTAQLQPYQQLVNTCGPQVLQAELAIAVGSCQLVQLERDTRLYRRMLRRTCGGLRVDWKVPGSNVALGHARLRGRLHSAESCFEMLLTWN